MVRSKNVLSLLMQVMIIFCLGILMFAIYGYSVSFTEGSNPFFGGFSKLFLKGMTGDSLTGTFSKATNIPELGFFVFQATFAAITPGLIIGALAERVKFSALLVFIILWLTFSYYPIAHMVWFWSGPDAFTTAEAGAAANINAGFLFNKGALDFAGGTVVHINAGIAGLVGALFLGKRIGFGTTALPPHNLPMVMIGASLLWVGWFGFNVGSNLEANGFATLVFTNTLLATAAATLAWIAVEWIVKGSPTMLGAASGAVAGLVAITPACGWVGTMGSIAIGVIAAVICVWACSGLKKMLGYDDSLDVFGVHCVGGIVGAILTGVFNDPALGGTDVYDYVANAYPDPAGVRHGRTCGLAALGCRGNAGVVGRGVRHRVQTGRSHHRPACERGTGARRPRHRVARRAGLQRLIRTPRAGFPRPSGRFLQKQGLPREALSFAGFTPEKGLVCDGHQGFS
jgi:Amt family ammonium transporter